VASKAQFPLGYPRSQHGEPACGAVFQHITYIPGAACDTSLFKGSDGRTFAVIPRYHIDLQEIDLTGLSRGQARLLGQPHRVITAENSDIGIEAKPTPTVRPA